MCGLIVVRSKFLNHSIIFVNISGHWRFGAPMFSFISLLWLLVLSTRPFYIWWNYSCARQDVFSGWEDQIHQIKPHQTFYFCNSINNIKYSAEISAWNKIYNKFIYHNSFNLKSTTVQYNFHFRNLTHWQQKMHP